MNSKKIAFIVLCSLLALVLIVTGITAAKIIKLFKPDSSLSVNTTPSTSATQPSSSGATSSPTTQPTGTTAPSSKPTESTGSSHVHSFTIVNNSQEASCSHSGWRDLRCACGEAKWEPIEKLAHTFGYGETIAATCTTDGCVRKTCTVCGETQDFDIVPATGHNYTSKSFAATCEDDSRIEFTCTNRNCPEPTHVEIKEDTALGHNFGNWSAGSDGVLSQTCARCGASHSTKDLKITENIFKLCTDGVNSSYKVHEILVGTDYTKQIYRYVITDYASQIGQPLYCTYSYEDGLKIEYVDRYYVSQTVTLDPKGEQATFELQHATTPPSSDPTDPTGTTGATDPTASTGSTNSTDPTGD